MNKRLIASFILSIFVSSFVLTNYTTMAYDSFYSQNDILFYDPNSVECMNNSLNTGTVDSNENLETILNYLTAKGFSLAAASGIAGNLFQESGYYPAKIQNSAIFATDTYKPVDGVGFGIAQWTGSDRQIGLVNIAASQGKSILDLNVQLDYMWQELNIGYTAVRDNLNTIKSNSLFSTTSAPMAAAIIFHGRTDLIASSPTIEITNVTNSSIGFRSGYEGSADTASDLITKRGKVAENIYNTYVGKIPDGTGVTEATIETLSTYSSSINCGTPSADATWPDNVETHGDDGGWTIKDNTDYSNVPCASGLIDKGTYYHPTRNFTIRKCETNLGLVASIISNKAVAMINDAASNGVTLTGNAWRSYESQIAARNDNCPYPETSKASDCDPPTAKAGDSQHEKGLAIDFKTIARVGSGPEWDWLVANGAKYGFYNLPSEGWHWSMSGS